MQYSHPAHEDLSPSLCIHARACTHDGVEVACTVDATVPAHVEEHSCTCYYLHRQAAALADNTAGELTSSP